MNMNQESRIRNQGKLKTIIHNSLFTIHLRKGFTLIELLVAVAILGVLATITAAILNPFEQFKKARDAQRKQDLRQIQTPLQAYYEDNGRFPAAEDKHIKDAPWGGEWKPYMSRVPKDPLSTETYLYESDAGGTYYRLYAKLENCKDPQMIPEATCTDYNYSVTSSNLVVALLTTPTPTPTFKRVFLTSTDHDSDLVSYVKTNIDENFTGNGLDAGDVICKTRADAASLDGTWIAWLSSSSVNAKDRIPDADYRLVDGTTIVANNKADLIDGTLDRAIILDEAGNDMRSAFGAAGLPIMTGTRWDGTVVVNSTCKDWTSTSSDNVVVGQIGWMNERWTEIDNTLCATHGSYWLYCFEQ